MNVHLSLSVLLCGAAFAQQDPLPTAVRAEGIGAALTAGAGLQPADADGRALRGGGARYRVQLDAASRRFEPALGVRVPTTQHLALRPLTVRCGTEEIPGAVAAVAPRQHGTTALYAHAPGVTERCEVRADGVEVSWLFATRPAGNGDLVVRYEVDTSLPAPRPDDGGLVFTLDGIGGVSIGDVTGIDANGARADGDVRWVDGALELSLPAAFVAEAAYPLVLDPLVAGVFDVSVSANDDTEPDAAFDATTSRWLVVWRRVLSATTAEPRGQLVTTGGALSGGTIFFTASGQCSRPRVANLGVRDRFGVVWQQLVGGTSTVQLQTVEAGNGALTFAATVATSATTQFGAPDIGSQCEAPIGQARGFVVVYEDEDNDEIRARRYWFTAADTLSSASAFAVYTNVLLGSSYSVPAISRTASSDGDLLVVVKRLSTLLTGSAISATVVDAGSNVPGATVTVVSSSENNVFVPDVDGYDGKWVVAWERAGSSSGPLITYDAVRTAPVTLDGGTLVVGASTGFGGALTSQASAPSLGYTPGRTWLGYRSFTPLGPTTSLRAVAIDSGSCASCADSFTASSPGGPRIVVATMTSGGMTNGEDCLAVFHDAGDDIRAQRLRNYGTNGSYTNLGGGCGTAGSQVWSHDPGIGSSGLRNTLNGVPATAIAAIFNFSAPSPTIPCGACVWLPFSVTLSPPILGTSAVVEFPIPCLQALVGQQFETQWTVIDFSQSPCAVFPGLALSNRSRMTIGD